MTVKEFFESKEKLAIRCDTEEKAEELLKAFDDNGYKWSDNIRYTDLDYWHVFKEETCYGNDNLYFERDYYQAEGYKILQYEDIEITIPPISDLSKYSIDELLEEIKKRIR